MYRTISEHHISFFDFNQGCGLQLDENNEWVQLSKQIPWKELEKAYAEMFPSDTGHPAKPLRMALGSLIIQKRKKLTDRGLVKEIAENPYLQYFIGMEQYSHECPFRATLLVSFRKRLDVNFLTRANELYLKDAEPTPEHAEDKALVSEDGENMGTFILDATCSPSNIKYPQDFVLLNDAREKLESMIDYFHDAFHPWQKPRTYRRIARKDYLEVAKSKRRTIKKLRSLIRKQLECIRRDLEYINEYIDAGYELPDKYINYLLTIEKLYEQQKYMFDNHTHRVENRIVSISQPYIRPIVRGKAKAPVEFGAKYDVSIDEKGHARLEQVKFDPYNESSVLQKAVEEYRKRTGHYPVRILVDQIYRTRENRSYCKEHGIRMSGPKLGRPSEKASSEEEKQDNVDRIEAERFFSREKRCNGAGLIMTKLANTTLASIALSVLVTNLFAISTGGIFLLFLTESENGQNSSHFIEFSEAS